MTRKMKDSGVEWIGEIPESWEILRLKNVADIITGNTPSKNNASDYYADEGMQWVKPDDLNGFVAINDTKERLNTDGVVLARVVPPCTPLVCCIGSIGKIGISLSRVAFNQQINAVLFDNDLYDYKFGMYFFSCQEEQHWYYANGNVVQILNTTNQKKIMLTYPLKEEQERISAYLDNKCSRIDEVIAREKQLVEKLKDYKQSMITEVVTKGLNPDVKLKASGIDWIGDIPEHWNVKRLRYVSRCQNGISKTGECFGSGYPFVSYSDVYKNIELPSNIEGLVESSAADRQIYSVEKGDIFFTRTSETIDEIGLTCVEALI